MDINVRPLLTSEKREVVFSYEIPLEYNENGYEMADNAKIDGIVKDMGGYVLLTAKCRVNYKTQCARCLKPVFGECEIEFERPVATKLESEDTEDEYLLVQNGWSVNIDEPITEELMLSLPLRSLCKEDCMGLCPKCGCDKNEKECGCVTKEIDPRWAALKNFKAKD